MILGWDFSKEENLLLYWVSKDRVPLLYPKVKIILKNAQYENVHQLLR